MSFRPQRKRSGGIYPSCRNNRRKVKSAAWKDPSTPFHFGRDDMLVGGTIHPHGLYLLRGMAMDHRRYIGYTVYWAIPFNRTGCIRNVAGGRFAAPTDTLMGACFNQRISKTGHVRPQ